MIYLTTKPYLHVADFISELIHWTLIELRACLQPFPQCVEPPNVTLTNGPSSRVDDITDCLLLKCKLIIISFCKVHKQSFRPRIL